MKKLYYKSRYLWAACLAVLLLFPVAILSQDESATTEKQADADLIALKIAEIEASTTLDEETAKTLVGLYRRALTNIERARVERVNADALAESAEHAPGELENTRKSIEKLRASEPTDGLRISDRATLSGLEQSLSDEKAKLVAAQERLANLRAQYTAEAARPALARQRLGDARVEREAALSERNATPPIGEMREVTEARHRHLDSRVLRLGAEIHKLEQELLTQEVRLGLLEAQEEYAGLEVERATARSRVLEETISGRRGAEAEQALQEAVTASQELSSQYEVVTRLAAENVEMGDRLTQRSLEIESASAQRDEVTELVSRFTDELSSTRKKLDIAGLNQAMGQLLIDQKRSLPNLNTLKKQTGEWEKVAADVGLEQIELGEQRRALRNNDSYIDKLVEDLPTDQTEAASEELRPLVESRRELVGKSMDAGARYLRVLGELGLVQRQLTDAVNGYRKFLDSTLLWVRNTSPIQTDALSTIPEDVKRLVSPANWKGFFRDFVAGLAGKPLYMILLASFMALGLLRRRFLVRIEDNVASVGRITKDRFIYSIKALVYTILAAVSIPIVFVLLAMVVLSNQASAPFSSSVATVMIAVAANVLIIQFFLDASREKGLLLLHCDWSAATVSKLRKELSWFLLVFPLARLIGDSSVMLDASSALGGLAVLGSVGSAAALAILLIRLFTPAGGMLRGHLQRHPGGFLAQARSFWLLLLFSVLPLLIILWLVGYNYTAEVLAVSFMHSFWLLLWLMLVQSLLIRWLVLGYQQEEYKAAVARRDAARAARRAAKESTGDIADDSEIELAEAQVDFAKLSSNSRGLVTTLMVLLGLFWLWLIWAPVIPALGILDDVSLWTRGGIIDGETVRIPVTLADLLVAAIVAFTTAAAAKGAPALLELFLLKRTSMTMGGRYTATTLLRYLIVGVGGIIVISMLGISWSKAQWLVAALGVGIGFGLQEIVANFISGLMLLFERPIRVGDTVTVGDTSGVVTRIQIRATTIRDWDNRELLVPNKEFITGRLLNWSLSDEIVRLVIPVGVAYGSDVALAMKLAEQAALEHELVLDDPEPSIIFTDFGDNALNLSLRVHLPSMDHRLRTQSELNQSINRKYAEAGIQIAFPQRDVHLDTKQPLEIRMRPMEGGTGQD